MEARKRRDNLYRTTVVCIDSYDDQVLKGRFYNAFHPDGEQFNSLMQFLIKMEHLHDDMDFPQAFSAMRSFAARVGPPDGALNESVQKVGKLATFTVRLLFRQNASWQGCVTWLEGDREESFRSVLELAFLMDSALRPTEE